MATKHAKSGVGRNRLVAIGFALAAAAALCWLLSPGGAPQLRADPEVFRTVDALYTAVRLRDETKLSQCERRLDSYRQAGRLPSDAAEHLAGIVQQARAGEWDAAAETLYDFMFDQRREATAGSATVAT